MSSHLFTKMAFVDKVALVTGAAQGLGKAYSKAFLQRGAKVCFCDVNEQQGETTKEEFVNEFGKDKVLFVVCDVTKAEDIANVFAKVKEVFGGVDIVVNNAGIGDEKQWEKCIQINVNGVIQGTQIALSNMMVDKGGRGGTIVNIASIYGLIPLPAAPVYTASKHAVVGYSRSIALNPEITKNGMRILCLCPNFAQTAILKGATPDNDKVPPLFRNTLQKFGVMNLENVVAGMIKLIEDKDNNGACLMVNKEEGLQYKDYDDPINKKALEITYE